MKHIKKIQPIEWESSLYILIYVLIVSLHRHKFELQGQNLLFFYFLNLSRIMAIDYQKFLNPPSIDRTYALITFIINIFTASMFQCITPDFLVIGSLIGWLLTKNESIRDEFILMVIALVISIIISYIPVINILGWIFDVAVYIFNLYWSVKLFLNSK